MDLKERIKQQLRAMPKASDRKIASILGVGRKAVREVRREMLDAGELPRYEMPEDGGEDI